MASSSRDSRSNLPRWRLILPRRLDGPTNMAIDEALLTTVGEGHQPPTLRFYDWDSVWVSLGSSQTSTDLAADALRDRGWRLSRRPSGGMAVVHLGQLGYALILPADDPRWQGDLAVSYERLSRPFVPGFERLGAAVHLASSAEKADFSLNAPALAARSCFGALGPYEIVANGKKIVGNSQVRRRHAHLQHGVIQLRGNQSTLVDLLACQDECKRAALRDYLDRRVGSLEALVGHTIGVEEVVHAVTNACSEAFEVSFAAGELTPRERELAETLVREKYGQEIWTFRR